jgi:3-oxoacyl-(acyl-carrier-protein) synthase
MPAFCEALSRGKPLLAKNLDRPGWAHPLRVRAVPPPAPRPVFFAHSRLRRTSAIAQHTVGAALEALGPDGGLGAGHSRLGIIFCAMAGCVSYSRRFYDETLKDPATASPLVFPETVFNAPASHLAALLGTEAISYTLVGDPGTFLQGLALGAEWLLSERVDGCLVIGAEESDWLVSDAYHLFTHQGIVSDGAGAVYLRREPGEPPAIALQAITEPQSYLKNGVPDGGRRREVPEDGAATAGESASAPQRLLARAAAAQRMRRQLAAAGTEGLLCDGLQGVPHLDRAEAAAWSDWTGPRLSPKLVFGEGFMAAAAWECLAAINALAQREHAAALVSVVGCNQQAIGARFATMDKPR